jgi:hypothetical protein
MKKIIKYVVGWTLVMLLILGILVYEIRQIKSENTSYWNNLKAIREQTDSIKTLQGQTAAQTLVMQFSVNELKELYPDLIKEIQNLKVKPNRVESFTSTAFETQKDIQITLKDSILRDSLKVKILKYQDEYFSVNGILSGNNQHLKITYKDTLIQVVFRGERENPWLWIFSKRKLQQRIVLKNPESKISYPLFIQIQK